MVYLDAKGINAWIPNFGQYKPERTGFTYHKEANYYHCTQEGGKQAILTYKGEKTDSKGVPIEVVNQIARIVHSESNAVGKLLISKR